MKFWKKRLPVIITAALFAAGFYAIVSISISYFRYVSKSIYTDSVEHLSEVYGQINNQFKTFIKKNWNFLVDYRTGFENSHSEIFRS